MSLIALGVFLAKASPAVAVGATKLGIAILAHYGIGAAIGAAIAAGTVIRGVKLTQAGATSMLDAIAALKEGNSKEAAKKFASFAIITGIGVDVVSEYVEEAIAKKDASEAAEVAKGVRKMENEIREAYNAQK